MIINKYFISILVLASFSSAATKLVLDKDILKERAAFALGVKSSDVTIEESERPREERTEYFDAIYDGKKYQCQLSYLKTIISMAVCRPTDGSDLPKVIDG